MLGSSGAYASSSEKILKMIKLNCNSLVRFEVTITITITNYLFRQNRTRNITKVILITHTKIPTLKRSCQGDCT